MSTDQKELPKKSLYDAQSPLDALLYLISQRNSKRKVPLSINQLSTKLGYRSPRALGMVLKGQRPLSQNMLWSVAKEFSLKQREARFLELLGTKQKLAQKSQDTSRTDAEIQDLIVREEPDLAMSTRAISYVSNWYHFVIKQLIAAPNFKNSEAWVIQRLRNKVTGAQISTAFRNLYELNLIEKDKVRGWKVVDGANIRSTEDIPSLAIRAHHAQMMQKAIEALSEQSVDEREMFSWTLRLDPSRIPEAKAYLRNVGREFNAKFFDESSPEVFQMNVQFFSHTSKNDD
jgi:uncharacterized protein (TIGR02147 family)